MANPYKHQICILSIFEIVSLGFMMAGIIVLAAGRSESCESGCVEQSCHGHDDNYYPCYCNRSGLGICESKVTVANAVYRLGISLLTIGIIGSILGSIFLCIYRRRYYYYRPPVGETVVIQTQVPVSYMQPQQMVGYPYDPNQNIAIVYGQPIPQGAYQDQNLNAYAQYPIQYQQNLYQNQPNSYQNQENPYQNPYPQNQPQQPQPQTGINQQNPHPNVA